MSWEARTKGPFTRKDISITLTLSLQYLFLNLNPKMVSKDIHPWPFTPFLSLLLPVFKAFPSYLTRSITKMYISSYLFLSICPSSLFLANIILTLFKVSVRVCFKGPWVPPQLQRASIIWIKPTLVILLLWLLSLGMTCYAVKVNEIWEVCLGILVKCSFLKEGHECGCLFFYATFGYYLWAHESWNCSCSQLSCTYWEE